MAGMIAGAAASKSPLQQAKIFRWFRTWISEDLFTAIESYVPLESQDLTEFQILENMSV